MKCAPVSLSPAWEQSQDTEAALGPAQSYLCRLAGPRVEQTGRQCQCYLQGQWRIGAKGRTVMRREEAAVGEVVQFTKG